MIRQRRHRTWVAFIAVFGLLFQQLAMAAYSCPIEAYILAHAMVPPPCHTDAAPDKSRCQEHCNPTSFKLDQNAPPPVLPVALPEAFTLLQPRDAIGSRPLPALAIRARAAAPPLNIQFCTWLI